MFFKIPNMISSRNRVVILALGLSACTVGPDFKAPDNRLPGSWSFSKASARSSDPAAIAGWWRRFNDPQLNRLVEQAVVANLDVKQAVARLCQARAQRQMAAASFWPWVTGTGSEQDSHVGGSGALSGHHRSYNAGLGAAWEVDLFGGNRRSYESAGAKEAAAAADLDGTRLSMAAEVAQTYCQLRSIQDVISVARRNLVTQEQSAQITRDRRGAGFASDLDVANAEALAANTKAAIPTLETSALQSAHAISVLLNRPPAELVSQLSNSRPIPTASAKVPTGIPSDLLRRRPDVRSAEANAHAATANIGVAIADLFPKFSLTGSVNQQSARLADWLSPSMRTGSYGPSFNWALFQGGSIQANIRVQQALRAQAVLAYRKTVLTALQEVEDAMTAGTNEHLRHAALAEAVTANQRAPDCIRTSKAKLKPS